MKTNAWKTEYEIHLDGDAILTITVFGGVFRENNPLYIENEISRNQAATSLKYFQRKMWGIRRRRTYM